METYTKVQYILYRAICWTSRYLSCATSIFILLGKYSQVFQPLLSDKFLDFLNEMYSWSISCEQHEFELHMFTCTWLLFNKYVGKISRHLWQVEKHVFSSYLIVRIQYKVNMTCKMCVNQLFMLSVRFLRSKLGY